LWNDFERRVFMKVEIKSWVGVVVLLCLGFVLGRITFLPDVNASPQESEIGRYQLIAGQYEATLREFNKKHGEDSPPTTRPISEKTLFRIDTATGEVDMYWGWELITTPESTACTQIWEGITGKSSWKN
jgi:hypothetical protein